MTDPSPYPDAPNTYDADRQSMRARYPLTWRIRLWWSGGKSAR
jgi:hypothetical protein